MRCSRPVGTTIEIKLFRGVFQQITTALMGQLFVFGRIPDLLYLLNRPTVKFYQDGRKIHRRFSWPACGESLPPEWHRHLNSRLPGRPVDISAMAKSKSELLACNGLAVKSMSNEISSASAIGTMVPPTVSVFDPDRRLPVNLTRTDVLGGRLPFEDAIMEDVARDVLAFALSEADLDTSSQFGRVFGPTHPAFFNPHRLGPNASYVFTSEGYSLLDPGLTNALNLSRLIAVVFESGVKA